METPRWKQAEGLFHEALERDSDARAHLLGDADPALRAEVLELIRAYEAAESNRLRAPASRATQPSAARRIGPYTVIKEIGEGGMGSVFLAERADAQYEKQVAIKLIRPGPGSHALIHRFHVERQILAGMEHPNIARLLDGGITDGGIGGEQQPFLVMDYVDGIRLDKYCDQHQLPVRRRLELFVKVCAAVHYAHQSLVVHRDLKPNNILVTEDGEPKLLDFGVAKVLQTEHHDIEQTVTVGLFFTPLYASPEILRGQHTTIATDVYSLGVILYQLLSGRLPHEEHALSPGDLMSAIITADPQQPSDSSQMALPHEPAPEDLAAQRGETPQGLRKLLRGDLDSIAMRALGKTPAERYGSAEQLAQDIQRYLERRPVLARRQTALYQLQKFSRRHWRGLLAACLAVIVLAATGVYAWRANLASARRFEEANTIAKYLLFDLYDEVAQLPGSTQVRARMAQRAQAELDTLAKLPQSRAQNSLDTAVGYDRLADVYGVSGSSSLGDAAAASTNLQRAKNILASLPEATPGVLVERARNALLESKLRMWSHRDTKGALPFVEAATRDLDRAATLRGDHADWLHVRFMLWVARADAAEFSEALPAEIDAANRGLAELRDWPDALQNSSDYPLWRALLLKRRGNAEYEQGHFAESLATFREADAIVRQADERFPNRPEILYNLMDLSYQTAFPMDKLHDAAGVIAALERSTALGQRLYELDPRNESLRRSYLNQREGLAQALAQNGKAAEGIREEERVVAGREEAAKLQAGLNGPAEDLAFSLSVLGSILLDSGEKQRACQVLRSSMVKYDALYQAGGLTAKNWNRHVGPLKKDLANCPLN